jgi:hypothetical protein
LESQVDRTTDGYLIFDDTVLDKNYSFSIELVRRQYSSNAHNVIKESAWPLVLTLTRSLINFGSSTTAFTNLTEMAKCKLDHVREMLTDIVHQKQLPFHAVLMDSWYATKDLTLFIESLQKFYYCPLKDNRQVDDSGGERPYQRIDSINWIEVELHRGKQIKIKGFP